MLLYSVTAAGAVFRHTGGGELVKLVFWGMTNYRNGGRSGLDVSPLCQFVHWMFRLKTFRPWTIWHLLLIELKPKHHCLYKFLTTYVTVSHL